MSEVLSARQLVKLAKQNEFSLALRQEWQKKTGIDPYNYLVLCVRHLYLMWATGCLFVVTAGLVVMVVLHDSEIVQARPVWAGSYVFNAITSAMVFVAVFAGISTLCYGHDTSQRRRVAGDFLDQFSRLLKQLGNVETELGDVARAIAPMDLDILRPRAKEATLTAALVVAERLDTKPKSVDSAWHESVSKASDHLSEVYHVFAVFDLVHGGRDYFIKEAKRRLRRKEIDELGAMDAS